MVLNVDNQPTTKISQGSNLNDITAYFNCKNLIGADDLRICLILFCPVIDVYSLLDKWIEINK